MIIASTSFDYPCTLKQLLFIETHVYYVLLSQPLNCYFGNQIREKKQHAYGQLAQISAPDKCSSFSRHHITPWLLDENQEN